MSSYVAKVIINQTTKIEIKRKTYFLDLGWSSVSLCCPRLLNYQWKHVQQRWFRLRNFQGLPPCNHLLMQLCQLHHFIAFYNISYHVWSTVFLYNRLRLPELLQSLGASFLALRTGKCSRAMIWPSRHCDIKFRWNEKHTIYRNLSFVQIAPVGFRGWWVLQFF